MLPRRLIGYFFISLINMKMIASATPLEEDRKLESSPQYSEISKLAEKASHLIKQDSYAEARDQFQALALDFEQKTENKVRLPHDPQFSEIVMHLTTPHFAEHAKGLKEEAGRMTSPGGLKVAILLGSKNYIDHVCKEYRAAKSHLKLIMQAIEPMLFSALLEASTAVDSRTVVTMPATSLSAIGCEIITLPEEKSSLNFGSHTLDLPQSTSEAVSALTFLGSLGDLAGTARGAGTTTITKGTVIYKKKIIPRGTYPNDQLPF